MVTVLRRRREGVHRLRWVCLWKCEPVGVLRSAPEMGVLDNGDPGGGEVRCPGDELGKLLMVIWILDRPE
jgi:hypothetical protein